jgi:hypothetical protein
VRRASDPDHLEQPGFEDAEPLLLCLLADDVEDGRGSAPTLLAFAGDRPLGSVRLRPHAPGELVTVLVEVLALVLPVGADRIVLGLPGRAWSTADPITPVADGVDLRQPVAVTVVADAHRGPCRLRIRLHPFDLDEQGRWVWQQEVDLGGHLDAPVVAALQVLLDRRGDVAARATSGGQLAAQFGRVLLLGHEVSLTPPTAEWLLTASAAAR